LVYTAIHILTNDFEIPVKKAKELVIMVIVKELKNQETTLEKLDSMSRPNRHIFIRRAANSTGELLVPNFRIKQSQILRG
jgi:hypothetical protein